MTKSQRSGGDKNVVIGNPQPLGRLVEAPAEFSDPVLCNGSEMEQGNAQTQVAVDRHGVCIGSADQTDGAIVEQEAIGLTVQVA